MFYWAGLNMPDWVTQSCWPVLCLLAQAFLSFSTQTIQCNGSLTSLIMKTSLAQSSTWVAFCCLDSVTQFSTVIIPIKVSSPKIAYLPQYLCKDYCNLLLYLVCILLLSTAFFKIIPSVMDQFLDIIYNITFLSDYFVSTLHQHFIPVFYIRKIIFLYHHSIVLFYTTIGASGRYSRRSPFWRLTGVLGSETYLAKVNRIAKNLGIHPFQTPSAILGPPGGHFGFLRFSEKEWSNQKLI